MDFKELLGTDLPVIQAPMAGVQDSQLAIAVCEAGGLGSLPCAMLDAETLRQELNTIQRHTNRPFNVNFFAHTSPAIDLAAQQRWQAQLSSYYAELDIPPESPPLSAGRKPFDNEMADIVAEFKPAVVSFHFGLPAAQLLEKVRASGAKILSTATTLAEAVWLEQQGVDAIIAQGIEAGGHRGMFLTEDIQSQIGTFALLSQVLNAVNLPVIAAGGIADAKGVKTVMQMGAVGAQIGTAYLLCPEAKTSLLHRQALMSEQARTTALTNVFSGRPARGIVNRCMEELGFINPLAPDFPLATPAMAPLRSKAERLGSSDFSPLWAGQNTSGCRAIPAAELTQQLCTDINL